MDQGSRTRWVTVSFEPTGHLQVKPRRGPRRSYHAFWRDVEGKHGRRLGPAHVKDSGRRTKRNSIIWRAADGPKPTPDHLTPKDADRKLSEILAAAPREVSEEQDEALGRTLRDALELSMEERIRDGKIRRTTVDSYDPILERLCRELDGDRPVTEFETDELGTYFDSFEALKAVSAATAEAAARRGELVREVVVTSWTVQPADSTPIDVSTKAEAEAVATELGGKWKHEARGVYRVTPLGARREKRTRRLEALRLQEQGWRMRQRTCTRHVIVRPADPQTRNKYRDFCSAGLNYAVREGWIARNPMNEVGRASLRSRRLQVLRREDFYDNAEVAALLAEVADLYERCFYELGFDAGLRLPGEGLGLTWGETDFDVNVIRPYNNFIDGEVGDPKTIAPIGIPMTPRLRADLWKIKGRGYLTGPKDPVFIDARGRVLPEKKLRRRFAEAASRAELKTIPMYNARHSFGTALARSGKVDIRTIQQLMRHSDIATTQQYMAYAPQPDLAVRMADALAPPRERGSNTPFELTEVSDVLRTLKPLVSGEHFEAIRRALLDAGIAC